MTPAPDDARRGPALARWLLGRLLSRRDARRLVDALDAEYLEFQRNQHGRAGAWLWYWRQALLSIAPLRLAVAPTATIERRHPLEGLVRDVRLALRTLWRSPAYSATAGLTLAIGIGATTAVFSVVDAVVLRPLPYASPERLVRAWSHTDDLDIEHFSFRVAEYLALAGEPAAFVDVAGEFPVSLSLALPGLEPRQVHGRMITPDFFRVFATGPVLGRMFDAEEIAGGSFLSVVVTHPFWTHLLDADESAIGRSIELGGRPYTVIGVLPADYRHVSGEDVEVFVPYTIGTSGWIGRWLDLYGRLQPGVSMDQAAAAIDAVMAAIGATDPRSRRWHATVEPLHQMVSGDAAPIVLTTFATVGLVLLIACLNVANLTLTRSAGRTQEIALRAALGAGRGSLIRQLLVENVLLAAGGAVIGVLTAVVGVRLLAGTAPASVPRLNDLTVDARVLVFALAVTLGTTLVFGLLPALRASRRTTPDALGPAARSTRPVARLGSLLGGIVVSEVALALALLVAAGLMVRTLHNLSTERFGFARAQALSFAVTVPSARWPGAEGTLDFYRRLREGLLAIPGVVAVGAGSNLPLNGAGAVASATSEPRVQAGLTEGITVLQRRAGPGFFEALGTPILAGRGFDDRDDAQAPAVAIISESLARRLYPAGEVVGRRVAFGGQPADAAWMTIVGVVADVRYRAADRVDDPQLYQAHGQSAVRDMSVVVRTRDDPRAIIHPAKAVLASVDPRVPMYDIRTLEDVVSDAVGDRRFAMAAVSLFAAVALVLAVGGVFGLLAFGVERRRRELGVRLALGARRVDIVRLVVREGITLVAVGVVLGSLAAMMGARLLDGLLYEVASIDVRIHTAATAVLAAAGLLAVYLPARRAARVDPAAELRRE